MSYFSLPRPLGTSSSGSTPSATPIVPVTQPKEVRDLPVPESLSLSETGLFENIGSKRSTSPATQAVTVRNVEEKDPKHNRQYSEIFSRYHLQSAASAYAISPNGEPLRLTGMRLGNVNSLDQNEITNKLFRYTEIQRYGGNVDAGPTAPEIPDNGMTGSYAISYQKTPMKVNFRCPIGPDIDGNNFVNLAYYHYLRMSRPDYLDLGNIIGQCKEQYPELYIREKDIKEIIITDVGQHVRLEDRASTIEKSLERLEEWKNYRIEALKGQYPGLEGGEFEEKLLSNKGFFTPAAISYAVDPAAMRAHQFEKYLSLLEDFTGVVEVDTRTTLPRGASIELYNAIVETNSKKIEEMSSANVSHFEVAIQELKDQGLEGTIESVAEKRDFIERAITKYGRMNLENLGELSKTELTDLIKFCTDFRIKFADASPGGMDIAIMQLGEPVVARARIDVEKILLALSESKAVTREQRSELNLPDNRKPWQANPKITRVLATVVGGALAATSVAGFWALGTSLGFPTVGLAVGCIVAAMIARSSFGWYCKTVERSIKLEVENPIAAAQLDGTTFRAAAVIETLLERLTKNGWVKRVGSYGDGRESFYSEKQKEDKYKNSILSELDFRIKAEKKYGEMTGRPDFSLAQGSLVDQTYYSGLMYAPFERAQRLKKIESLYSDFGLTADQVLHDHLNPGSKGINRFAANLSPALFGASGQRRNDNFVGKWVEVFPDWVPFYGKIREPRMNMDYVARQLNVARAEIEAIAFNYHTGFTPQDRKEFDQKALARMQESVVKDIADRCHILKHPYLCRIEALLFLKTRDPNRPQGKLYKFFDGLLDAIPTSLPPG